MTQDEFRTAIQAHLDALEQLARDAHDEGIFMGLRVVAVMPSRYITIDGQQVRADPSLVTPVPIVQLAAIGSEAAAIASATWDGAVVALSREECDARIAEAAEVTQAAARLIEAAAAAQANERDARLRAEAATASVHAAWSTVMSTPDFAAFIRENLGPGITTLAEAFAALDARARAAELRDRRAAIDAELAQLEAAAS